MSQNLVNVPPEFLRQLLKLVPGEAWREVMAEHVLPPFTSAIDEVRVRIDKLSAPQAAESTKEATDRMMATADKIQPACPTAGLSDAVLLESFQKESWVKIREYLHEKKLLKPVCSLFYGNHTSKFFDTPEEMYHWLLKQNPSDTCLLHIEMMTIGKDHWHAPLGSSFKPLEHKAEMLAWVGKYAQYIE